MATVKELLARGISDLADVTDTPGLDAEVLLAASLGKNRVWLRTWPDNAVPEQECARFLKCLGLRVAGQPVAYILGTREFWSLQLKVNEYTLIPRPETELLVETVLERVSRDDASVIDLGTGTGAIALALASERPRWNITATDKFGESLALARDNALALNLAVNFIESDWFDAVPARLYDVVVSNPPYIDPADPHLSRGDVRFEPRRALVSPDNGLADIAQIAAQAKAYLPSGGVLLFEHGFDQGAGVRKLLSPLGYDKVETLQDLAGQDRVTFGYKT